MESTEPFGRVSTLTSGCRLPSTFHQLPLAVRLLESDKCQYLATPSQVVPRQSALDWQFVELLHPAFTRRQQFFWGGLKNHKRPKNQGIVRTASDEPGHEGVRVLGSFAHGHAA